MGSKQKKKPSEGPESQQNDFGCKLLGKNDISE